MHDASHHRSPSSCTVGLSGCPITGVFLALFFARADRVDGIEAPSVLPRITPRSGARLLIKGEKRFSPLDRPAVLGVRLGFKRDVPGTMQESASQFASKESVMSQRRSFTLGLVAAAALLASGALLAHPKIVATTPADHAEVSAPATVQITFSETLMTQLSGADLTMTEKSGTAESTKIEAKTTASSDAKSLVITPTHPLSPGAYRVDWHAVSTDTHAVKGSFSFRVK